MQSIGSGIANYLQALDPSAAKAARAARNNACFEEAVRRVWDDNPFAAEYVLAHVNSLYFAKEDPPKDQAPQGASSGKSVLGLYVDDAAARAEVNARRETLMLALMQDGFRIDEVRILPSRLGMRERRAFPSSCERVERMLAGTEEPERATSDTASARAGSSGPAAPSASAEAQGGAHRIGNPLKEADESKLLETFKRAVCLAVGDIDQASALLSHVEGAHLEQRYADRRKRQASACYACKLYAPDPGRVAGIVESFSPSIIAHAKELGLCLVGIDIIRSAPEMAGCRAFPVQGRPKPLQS